MAEIIKIGIRDYKETEEIIEKIASASNNFNLSENLNELLDKFDAETLRDFLTENLEENIQKANAVYSSASRIINPDAVKRIKILRKSIREALKITDDENVFFHESIENDLGWSYSLAVLTPYIGFASNTMTLLKIAILSCDSFETAADEETNCLVMFFNIDNVFKLI